MSRARVLLDSTVIIDALRGRPAAPRIAGLRRLGIEPWACAVSVEEIDSMMSATPEGARLPERIP